MNVTIGFSGGISHSHSVTPEQQLALASSIASAVKAAVEKNYAGGSLTVTVGTTTDSTSVTAIGVLPEDYSGTAS